jgi:hypothetical protein
MSEIVLKAAGFPATEYSSQFVQGMVNAMGVSFFKYGAVANAYPINVNALDSLQKRIERYLATGNIEYLIDVANFAMIEFMHPSVEGAFYQPTDADGSPGRVSRTRGDMTQDDNSVIGMTRTEKARHNYEKRAGL